MDRQYFTVKRHFYVDRSLKARSGLWLNEIDLMSLTEQVTGLLAGYFPTSSSAIE